MALLLREEMKRSLKRVRLTILKLDQEHMLWWKVFRKKSNLELKVQLALFPDEQVICLE